MFYYFQWKGSPFFKQFPCEEDEMIERFETWISILDYSSNQMKKTQNKEKNTIFKKVKFAHQKINEKNTFFAVTNWKIKIFAKFKKQLLIKIT
jgi:ABC-type microcin C transport system permease subunit YejE